MVHCGRMSQRTIDLRAVLRRELPWFAVMAGALLATFVFAHWVVRRDVILPSVATGGAAPPWVWAALYLPELVAAFMIGWRLRSWPMVLLYAGGAAVVREGFHAAMHWAGQMPHPRVFASGALEIAVAVPLAVLAYAVVFAVASASGREDARLDAVDAQ
jgi:hypothetical protein